RVCAVDGLVEDHDAKEVGCLELAGEPVRPGLDITPRLERVRRAPLLQEVLDGSLLSHVSGVDDDGIVLVLPLQERGGDLLERRVVMHRQDVNEVVIESVQRTCRGPLGVDDEDGCHPLHLRDGSRQVRLATTCGSVQHDQFGLVQRRRLHRVRRQVQWVAHCPPQSWGISTTTFGAYSFWARMYRSGWRAFNSAESTTGLVTCWRWYCVRLSRTISSASAASK